MSGTSARGTEAGTATAKTDTDSHGDRKNSQRSVSLLSLRPHTSPQTWSTQRIETRITVFCFSTLARAPIQNSKWTFDTFRVTFPYHMNWLTRACLPFLLLFPLLVRLSCAISPLSPHLISPHTIPQSLHSLPISLLQNGYAESKLVSFMLASGVFLCAR